MMTDEELDSFEDACKDALAGMYGYSSKQYLELIAMIRQARAERDWLARMVHHDGFMRCPQGRKDKSCKRLSCKDCWLKAAKEATCPKN